ncbi:uncharacterized protein tespa1 isoform X3 [Phyllopteryx taeniolatus]|uniref:uncharacterized protein tespa1 isoform X3 n=1 Tax=Phyllopteryx taeniolatus TaxID=161469 RepID=UPI002AD3A65A|nr:uncharacterized protein tespa1 isoform X3 [Phyllopteryx taeniolatus]
MFQFEMLTVTSLLRLFKVICDLWTDDFFFFKRSGSVRSMQRASWAKIANNLQVVNNCSASSDGKLVLHCQEANVGQRRPTAVRLGRRCFTQKTELLLQNCALEACPQNSSLRGLDSTLNGGDVMSKAGLAMHPASKERNSGLVSNVPEVLQLRSEDAEEILWQLGFGCDDPQFSVRRIREEDPSLCIASRFRQVQALTAMANAFCSLYSHVSRTPLRKLRSPQFTFTVSSPAVSLGSNVRRNPRSSVRSEPRSPAERLKDTVSMMCLYTSPRRKSSLSDVGDPIPQQLQTTKTLDSVDGRQTHRSEEDNRIASQMVVKTHPKQNHSDSIGDNLKPLARVTYEVISPEIVERVHRANTLHHVFLKIDAKDESSLGVQNRSMTSESASRPLPVQTPAVSSDEGQHSDSLTVKPPRCIDYLKNCNKEISLDLEVCKPFKSF